MELQGKRIFFIIPALFLFWAHGEPMAAEDSIEIGTTLSLTGGYSEPSEMIYEAYRLWETQINKNGGLLGRTIELRVIDDTSRPDVSRQGYQQLIEDNDVDLVLSPYSTPITLAASEVTEEHGYVLIACGASGEVLWNRNYSYLFGMYSMARRYFIGFLDLMAREGLETVCIIHENNAFNRDAAVGASEWATLMGVTVKSTIEFDPEGDRLPHIAEKVKRLQPDGIIACTYPPSGYRFLSLINEIGFKPEALGMTITPVHPSFHEKAGPMAEHVFAPSQWEPNERIPFPGTKRFIRAFKNFTGILPSYHAGSAYAACQILEKAVRKTEGLNHENLRDYIMSLDTVTVIGRFKVDETGMQIGHNPLLIQWQDGKKEIVYPPHMRTAPPEFE
jgi:branched-chain amino acid transport system substrate-binding protein